MIFFESTVEFELLASMNTYFFDDDNKKSVVEIPPTTFHTHLKKFLNIDDAHKINSALYSLKQKGLIELEPSTIETTDPERKYRFISLTTVGEKVVEHLVDVAWPIYINSEKRIERIRGLLFPELGKDDWKILKKLYSQVNHENKYGLTDERAMEIAIEDGPSYQYGKLLGKCRQNVLGKWLLRHEHRNPPGGSSIYYLEFSPHMKMLVENDYSPLETGQKYFKILSKMYGVISHSYRKPSDFFESLFDQTKERLSDEEQKALLEDLACLELIQFNITDPTKPLTETEFQIALGYQVHQYDENHWLRRILIETFTPYPFYHNSLGIEKNQVMVLDEFSQELSFADRNELKRRTSSEQPIEPLVRNKYFHEIDIEAKEPFCFVIMPFRETEFPQRYYNEIIKPHIENTFEIKCFRSDEDHMPNKIDNKIYTYISRARFLVAEITSLNPNVMYELGLAHMRNKDVVLLTQNESKELPFDISTILAPPYKADEYLRALLTLGIKALGVKIKTS